MPTEDNDVLKKNQHDESDSNELDDLELDNYRQNTNLSPKNNTSLTLMNRYFILKD